MVAFMKTISVFFLFMLLVSCSHNVSQQEPERLNSIHDILLHELTYMDDKNQYLDRTVYVHNHKDEIEKTFRVNEIDTCGNLFIAYYSCSIGAEIARDVAMFTKIGDTLCLTNDADLFSAIFENSILGDSYVKFTKLRYHIPDNVDLHKITNKIESWDEVGNPWWFNR